MEKKSTSSSKKEKINSNTEENIKRNYLIKSVVYALSILDAISEESGDFSLTEISSKVGLAKSHVFRVLATFEKYGYVRHSDSCGFYRAGLKAYEVGGRFLRQMELLKNAQPILERVAKNTSEAIYLAIRDENEILLVDMVDSPQKVRVNPLVGKRFPLHEFSAGKVLLEHSSSAKSPKAAVASAPQPCCVDHGAIADGVSSLAVPVINAQKRAFASLCLVAPDFRLTKEQLHFSLIPSLVEAGEELSIKMGYAWQKTLIA